ncbi:MAG: hypothetical protein ACK5AL_11765 [Planctomycetota bacterium]
MSALFALLAACGHDDCDPPPPAPNPVSILVEVYDPATNLVLPGVRVRVIDAYQEWAGLYYESPYQDVFVTDAFGQVFLDEYLIAFQDVGFREDANGRALLFPGVGEDEAFVLVEVDADGSPPFFYELALSWGQPDIAVGLPYP